jgi:hypothetical protein
MGRQIGGISEGWKRRRAGRPPGQVSHAGNCPAAFWPRRNAEIQARILHDRYTPGSFLQWKSLPDTPDRVPPWPRGVGGFPHHKSRGRTGFDRMARGSDCVSWLVGWPR